jgi:Lipopolysaccharide-assembly
VKLTSLCAGALALLFLAGCAGYRLGPTGGRDAGSQSLQIAPFTNETEEARLLDPLTTALRRRTQQDGTFELATRGDADLLLTGRIVDYRRQELSFDPGDVVTVRDYQLVMTVHATVRDRSSGRDVLDRRVTGRTTIRVATDLTSAERQAMPLLADDLARNLIGILADGDW